MDRLDSCEGGLSDQSDENECGRGNLSYLWDASSFFETQRRGKMHEHLL